MVAFNKNISWKAAVAADFPSTLLPPKTSHSCPKKWYTMFRFSRHAFFFLQHFSREDWFTCYMCFKILWQRKHFSSSPTILLCTSLANKTKKQHEWINTSNSVAMTTYLFWCTEKNQSDELRANFGLGVAPGLQSSNVLRGNSDGKRWTRWLLQPLAFGSSKRAEDDFFGSSIWGFFKSVFTANKQWFHAMVWVGGEALLPVKTVNNEVVLMVTFQKPQNPQNHRVLGGSSQLVSVVNNYRL